jgi:hypothetical protein
MSSVLLWGEMGAGTSGGSLNLGFHSHLRHSHVPTSVPILGKHTYTRQMHSVGKDRRMGRPTIRMQCPISHLIF